jgi:CheY-like chemotaxis protein
VLVVDDEPGTRDLVQNFLDEEGYESVSARDGAEALVVIAQKRPALVLLDLNMPIMSGWEMNAHLRALELGIPVIFMSAADDLRAEAAHHGAAGWLAKPFDLEELLRMVQRHCGPGA